MAMVAEPTRQVYFLGHISFSELAILDNALGKSTPALSKEFPGLHTVAHLSKRIMEILNCIGYDLDGTDRVHYLLRTVMNKAPRQLDFTLGSTYVSPSTDG